MSKRGPTGPKADTLFSEFWAKYGHQINAELTPYNLVRWGFREGFKARGDRDRKVRARPETEGKDHG